MSCENVQERISSLIDRKIGPDEREEVLAHLQACIECDRHFAYMQLQRAALLRMRNRPVPPALQERLRVTASYERVRQLSRATFVSRRRRWLSSLQLTFENLMRPAALPFAGGLLSTALVFSLLLPQLIVARSFGEGPSTQIFTIPDGRVVGAIGEQPRIEPVESLNPDYQTVIELTVDNYGSVTDYQVTRGQLTPDLKDLIMFSRFTPATLFGRRTTAKVKIVYGKITQEPGMRS